MTTPQFEGTTYRLSNEWTEKIPLEDKPINYLEIGAFYGGNVVSVNETYAKHPESKIYVVDPWLNYEAYDEYHKLVMNDVYETFTSNTQHIKEKMVVNRGYSDDELPKLQNDFFDIIYIDGNHDSAYAFADAVLSFAKLKIGGYMIFDDYDLSWTGVLHAVTAFVEYQKSRIEILGVHKNQAFLKKVA